MVSKFLQILGLQPRILEFQNFFSINRSIFLTVGQNNFGNKIPYFLTSIGGAGVKKLCETFFEIHIWHFQKTSNLLSHETWQIEDYSVVINKLVLLTRCALFCMHQCILHKKGCIWKKWIWNPCRYLYCKSAYLNRL